MKRRKTAQPKLLRIAGYLLLPAVAALVAYAVALTLVVVTPLVVVAVLWYVAAPYYDEFFPQLSPAKRKIAYGAALAAALGPLAGAVLTLNPEALWHPAQAAWLAFGLGTAGLVLGSLGLLAGAFWRQKQYRLIAALPTSRAASAALGLVELQGRVRAWLEGRDIVDCPARVHPPVFLPGFWLEDESGRVWVEPGAIPVRAKVPRAFGFKVNDVVLSRRSQPSRLGLARRFALHDGDRVHLVGYLRAGTAEEKAAGRAAVVSPAPQQGSTRDYRHIFFLSDSSEKAALAHVRRGVRSARLLAWLWVAAASAILMHATPRALHQYDTWSLREVVTHLQGSERERALILRWHLVPAERRQGAVALAQYLQPPGAAGAFEVLAAALAENPREDHAVLYGGLGKLHGHAFQVVPYLTDGMQRAETRTVAAHALYQVSGSSGFDAPHRMAEEAFSRNPHDTCAALAEFAQQAWWAINIGGPLGVEMAKRCPADPTGMGQKLIEARIAYLPAKDAPAVFASLSSTWRGRVFRQFLYRKEVDPALARAALLYVNDTEPESAAMAGALALRSGDHLPYAAEGNLVSALRSGDEDTRYAAALALRALPGLSAKAREALWETSETAGVRLRQAVLETLVRHEPPEARETLSRRLRSGNSASVRARYALAQEAGLQADSLPTYVSAEVTRETVEGLRQLTSLAHRADAQAYVGDRVLRAMRSPNADLRREGAVFVGRLRFFTQPVVDELAALLADPVPEVRIRAADALLKLAAPPDSIRPALERAAERNDSGVGETARTLLRRITQPLDGGARIRP